MDAVKFYKISGSVPTTYDSNKHDGLFVLDKDYKLWLGANGKWNQIEYVSDDISADRLPSIPENKLPNLSNTYQLKSERVDELVSDDANGGKYPSTKAVWDKLVNLESIWATALNDLDTRITNIETALNNIRTK